MFPACMEVSSGIGGFVWLEEISKGALVKLNLPRAILPIRPSLIGYISQQVSSLLEGHLVGH